MTSEIAKLHPASMQAMQPPSEASAILHIIERASRDPSIDIDKLERLIGLQERAMAQRAKVAYAAALSEMQPELPVIKERGQIKIGTGPGQKYALWEDVNQAIRPVLAKHGFALTFRTGRTGETGTQISVTGVLSHREGHSEETTMHLPLDTSGSKNAVQSVGSSTSYGKRYTAAALLNLTTGEIDDDGVAGGRTDTIRPHDVERIQLLIVETASDISKFLRTFEIGSIEEMDGRTAARAIALLEQKKAKSNADR